MIRIIEAEEKHLPSILQIERAAFQPPWTEGTLLCEVGREEAYFALAIGDGDDAEADEVLGFCILHQVSDEAELYQIAVSEASRGRGIARQLMEEALTYAKSRGIVAVFLEVRKSNAPAVGLYKKFGYKVVGRRKNYYDNPLEDAFIMELKLMNEPEQV
jgi:ribosomal-protein-alanine N-acetyltransferase